MNIRNHTKHPDAEFRRVASLALREACVQSKGVRLVLVRARAAGAPLRLSWTAEPFWWVLRGGEIQVSIPSEMTPRCWASFAWCVLGAAQALRGHRPGNRRFARVDAPPWAKLPGAPEGPCCPGCGFEYAQWPESPDLALCTEATCPRKDAVVMRPKMPRRRARRKSASAAGASPEKGRPTD